MVRTWGLGGLGGQLQFRFENLGIWAGHNTLGHTSVCTPSVLGVLTSRYTYTIHVYDSLHLRSTSSKVTSLLWESS